MSQQIYTPINQVKLTNVAVVRMNKGGKRFEIACYKNKVVDYRAGLEQDLSEVLQTERIFTNVSKGEFAKAKDMLKVFGTKDEDEISKLILSKGQLQVSDKERTQQNEKTSAQIAEWISKNCVHPASDRPYTISQIRHAMQQANISIHPSKPLKRQYLDCVKLLQKVVPIRRAKMELLLLIPSGDKTDIERTLKDNDVVFPEVESSVNEDDEDDDKKKDVLEYKILVDPSLYRILNDAMEMMIGARIEIVNQVVTKQGDVNLELEVGNHQNNTLVQQNEEDTATDNHAAKLLSQVHISSQDKHKRNDNYNRNDNNDSNDNNSDNENEEMSVANRRKAQKKKKKKNQKASRRIEDSDTNDYKTKGTSTTSTSNQQQGGFEQSSTVSHNTNTTHTISTTISNNDNNNSDPSSTRKSCNTCGGGFDTPAEFRSHFKSDWHKFNQKLKMNGTAPVCEKEFLLCDSDAFFSSDIL